MFWLFGHLYGADKFIEAYVQEAVAAKQWNVKVETTSSNKVVATFKTEEEAYKALIEQAQKVMGSK